MIKNTMVPNIATLLERKLRMTVRNGLCICSSSKMESSRFPPKRRPKRLRPNEPDFFLGALLLIVSPPALRIQLNTRIYQHIGKIHQ